MFTVDDEFEDQDVRSFATEWGPLRVTCTGARKDSNPTLLTLSDIALTHESCFASLLSLCNEKDILSAAFIVHIDLPGLLPGDEEIPSQAEGFDLDILCDHIEELRRKLNISTFVGFGVGLGSSIWVQYAIKYTSRIQGLLLAGLVGTRLSWIQTAQNFTSRISWLWSKNEKCMGDLLISRFFSEKSKQFNPDLIQYFERELFKKNKKNVWKYIDAYSQRRDISNELKTFKFPVLLFIGEHAQEYEEMVTTRGYLQGSAHDWISVPESGILVTEESPEILIEPINLFFKGLGYIH